MTKISSSPFVLEPGTGPPGPVTVRTPGCEKSESSVRFGLTQSGLTGPWITELKTVESFFQKIFIFQK